MFFSIPITSLGIVDHSVFDPSVTVYFIVVPFFTLVPASVSCVTTVPAVPPAGTKVEKGTQVYYFVSKGSSSGQTDPENGGDNE